MTDEEFAHFVDLMHRGEGADAATKDKLLAHMRTRLPDLTDEQATSFLELQRDYVRRFEEEIRKREHTKTGNSPFDQSSFEES